MSPIKKKLKCTSSIWVQGWASVIKKTTYLSAASIFLACTSQKYPDSKVIEYVNLGTTEILRQKMLNSEGVQEISAVVLPEEQIASEAPSSHFGWPHAVIIDGIIVVHFRIMNATDQRSGMIRSVDGGKSWDPPVFFEDARIVVMTATNSGKIVAAAVDRERKNTLNVLISIDKGITWRRHSANVKTPGNLTARIIEHPRFGLITGGHGTTDSLTFLVSEDEGQTWRNASFPVKIPLNNHGTVVFGYGEGNFGVFVRNHEAPGPWQPFAQFSPINLGSARRFEDLTWIGGLTNIWVRKSDTSDAIYNPVTRRIEAVTTKRDWGIPQTDRGYMTLNLWSISTDAFQKGHGRWRHEGVLLRSKGEKARVENPRDGMHPVGSVIDEQSGLQHIFIYAGDRAHGGDGAPETGNTGIFRLSRILDTKRWVQEARALENYDQISQISEDFKSLNRWSKSGSPTGEMTLPRTEPPYRTDVRLPEGVIIADENENLFIKTNEPGYYGLHCENVLVSNYYRLEFKARIESFPNMGYPIAININRGAEKYGMIIQKDGIYELSDAELGQMNRIIEMPIDNDWHVWKAEVIDGISNIYLDGQFIGQGKSVIDGSIGQRPVTVSAWVPGADDNSQVRIDYLRFQNLDEPDERVITNSLGMEMVRIEPGEFRMGNEGEIDYSQVALDAKHARYMPKGSPNPHIEEGPEMDANPLEWDESPEHLVKITQPFYMSSTPVTNRQFEAFRPQHRELRGKQGYSKADDDAVVYVSWEDAVAFTQWLSKKEGRPYRLPTEAEWEYAARAGTTTPYFTGKSLPAEYHHYQVMNRSHALDPENVNLTVGKTSPNPWGLFDIHGLVEEWCLDWYGPYKEGPQADPVGWSDGVARVTRGGSHSTGLPFLRSASRAGALPETGHFLIGLRVVMGEIPGTKPLTNPDLPVWAQNVEQDKYNWPAGNMDKEPVFLEPKTYTRIPHSANGPLYFIHNHNPALAVLPNGDLFAIWFTTVKERGREMLVAGARLRQGEEKWDDPDIFFQVPGRNQTGQALWWDGQDKIYYFSGVGTADHWRNLSLVMRTSTDNGATWTKPRIIGPEYGPRHQPIDAVIKTRSGAIIFTCDAGPLGKGGSVVHISNNLGETWTDPGEGKTPPIFTEGNQGAWIAGIHAPIIELQDGRLMAFGRGDEINGKMPVSISADIGKTWTYSASDFDPIGGAQRAAMVRLKEGPILFLSFTKSLEQSDSQGNSFTGSGMFVALSYDEGKTWPVRKLITPGGPRQILKAPCNHRWGEEFSTLDFDRAESRGYLTAAQSPDGLIHVLSSGTHYAFNLSWIESAPSPAKQQH